jgi:tRNA(fMet)-specific endonuclease VapC
VYCFDTDVLSSIMKGRPPLALIRRLAQTPPEEQFTTTITLGELLYGASRHGHGAITERVRDVIEQMASVLPFDSPAADIYGPLRAGLESEGRRLGEPDLRIASIALSRGLSLVTGNVHHFARVADLRVENWLSP